jgi:ABC-type glutathione transport system ATPase component
MADGFENRKLPTEKLKVENLTKIFGRDSDVVRAVDGVSLSISAGEILGLVGESGSGKSTLARLILGLLPPTAGRVYFDGQDIAATCRKTLCRKRQIVFQDPYASLNPRRRIFDAIYEPLCIHNIYRGNTAASRSRVFELLGLVKLPRAFAARYPHELSGGERQRVMLARALSLQPEFLVCDEPVSSLDVSIRAEILRLLSDIQKQFNLTILFVSHDLAVVYNFCDRVAVMHNGKIVEDTTPAQIFRAPQQEYTRSLIQAVPKKLYNLLA